jgi:hypothetical protein
VEKVAGDKRILILDDDGTEGNIFLNCRWSSNTVRNKNIATVETIPEFLEKVRSYDIRFIDFGELGYDGCQKFHGEGISVIAAFLEENPSIDVWFVLTMPWNYYEGFTELWKLPNAHHIQLDDHRERVDAILEEACL